MNRFVIFLGIASRNVFLWMFVTVPVWIWTNIFLAAILQGWTWFRNQVRRYAGWVILASVALLLIATGQKELLNIIGTYVIAFAVLYYGLRVMLRGILPKNRRK